MSYRASVVIPAAGTTSSPLSVPAGYRLAGVEVPTMTSTDLTVKVASDAATFRDVYNGATQLNKLLSASTGGIFASVPDLLSELTEGMTIEFIASVAQSGGLTLTAILLEARR